jgi:hypothetical protein
MCIHYDQPDGAPPPRQRYSGTRRSSAGDRGKARDTDDRYVTIYGCGKISGKAIWVLAEAGGGL